MASKPLLKIVAQPGFYQEEIEFQAEQSEHSLHYVVAYPFAFSALIPQHFIHRYTGKGASVLDPFCGSGTTALASALAGRAAMASDVNPLAVKITRAKLEPAELTDVTLRLQSFNLRRPVALAQFNSKFSAFYDPGTFRELLNLRYFVGQNYDRVGRYIELMAIGLLHGHSAGYCSVYSFPHISISPEEQQTLNQKRGQSPDYRAVAPRILRKVAAAMRDGIPSEFDRLRPHHRVSRADARDLGYLPESSIDLVVTAPPLPGRADPLTDMWLRLWFVNSSPESLLPALPAVESMGGWRDFMNEVLVEMARVVKPGARAVFVLRGVRYQEALVQLDQEMIKIVEHGLSRFWEPEGLLVERSRCIKLKDCLKPRQAADGMGAQRLLVLRRR